MPTTKPSEPETYLFIDDGSVPNNPRLPGGQAPSARVVKRPSRCQARLSIIATNLRNR